MRRFFDPVSAAWRQVMTESQRKSEDQRILQAFRNGIAVGIVIGASLVSIVWAVVGFFR